MKLRGSPVELLAALGLLLATAPFVEDLPHGDVIEVVLLTLVMVFAVRVAGGRRRSLIVAALLCAPALAAKWLNHLRPDLLHPAVFASTAVLFFGFVVAQIVRFLVQAPRVDGQVLCAGVAGFLMLGVLWAPAYLAAAQLHPGAFNLPASPGSPTSLDGFSAFYFSFITLCTVGYGDITPVSKGARMLAVLEAIVGLFYMALLISRLVSIYAAAQPAVNAKEPDNPDRM